MKDLTIGQELDVAYRDYALACALLFLEEYIRDRRLTTYAELAYYIILKYCLASGHYQALFDFTANFGYYPITRKLLTDGMVRGERMLDQLMDLHIDKFSSKGYTETLHQYNVRSQLVPDQSREIVYVAPTSYGKSSIIIDVIKRFRGNAIKTAIIVPTKSLLMQTYRMIRQEQLGTRVIMHDEMYDNEQSFIAIFTQERCLRLMSKTDVSFDLLFIDEAHNLFDDDPRSILLSRLLVRNKARNPSQRVIYLSPLIEGTDNVKTSDEQTIRPYTIPFNIKEPDIFEYRANRKKYQYNRFVNEFYELDLYEDMFDYIKKHALKKNFLYCYRPKLVEQLASELSATLPVVEVTAGLQRVINTLRSEIHELFYLVDYLEHGVVYLHGKLPELIKEYVESKFSEIGQLKYLVANTVILEGMNLPVDNLYVLNTHKLNGKELTNLIGRVNRLNTIFGEDAPPDAIFKLVPPIHFVNNNEYNRSGGKMQHKIKLLRSRIFKDVIGNCTLENYDLSSLPLDPDAKDKKQEKDRLIRRDEATLAQQGISGHVRLKQYLIESGISAFYYDVDVVLDNISEEVELQLEDNDREEIPFMERLYRVFIRNCQQEISDYSFGRLSNVAAREFYNFYVTVVLRRSLKQNIAYLVEYYRREVRKGNRLHYFGKSYGDQPSPYNPSNNHQEYLDLSRVSDEELVNLAIVKLKMEDDFVSFKLNKFIVMLHEYKLISTNEFHNLIYGTTDVRQIEMTKMGMSISLIKRLEADGLLPLLELDEYGNLQATPAFYRRKSEMSDIYFFEVKRFL